MEDDFLDAGFKIETIPQAYPSYPTNLVLRKKGSPYIKFHTKVTFKNGTVIDNYGGDWICDNKYYSSLEQIFDVLPEEIQQIILFNLDIFRGI
jgi:hypothetical protein